MSISKRAATLVAAAALLAAAAPRTTHAQPTIVALGRALGFGTVLPGTGPVAVTPWAIGSWQPRVAPVFEIRGTPNSTVYVKLVALPTQLEDGNGNAVAVTAWTAYYNTVNSAAGAVALPTSVGVETALTLSAAGRGYVSLGASISPTSSQPKGSYGLGEAGAISVR